MANALTQIGNTLTQLPQCAQTAIVQGITSSTCGLDIACVCRDEKFSTLLQNTIASACNRHDQEATLSVARQLCLAAIPSLNETKNTELVATVTIMLIIATTAVILRFYARRISESKLGADDYLILLALVLTYGVDINAYYSIKSGVGRHMITVSLDSITSFIKTDQASQVLFGCSITATKLSILFFYHRIFPFRTFYIVSLIVGIATILWWIGLMLTAFLHCRPLAYYWDRSIPNGYCVNDNLIGYTITSVNIVADLVVLVLPIPWLWGMNMTVRRRLAVVGLFVLGSFVCVAGIVRLPLLAELKLSDVTWTSVSVGIWVDVECNIGILSACLPIMRPLFSTKYPSSPTARFVRLVRSINITSPSGFNSSSGDNSSSSDPEKGIIAPSEPSSDATMVEGMRWPNDNGSKTWRWNRGNNESTTAVANQNLRIPAQGGGGGGVRHIENNREKKSRTWYSAAADALPEMDLARQNRKHSIFDADKVPRYRDDNILILEKSPISPPPLSPKTIEFIAEKKPEETDKGGIKPERSERRLEVWEQRHSDALRSGQSSQRSSWGMRRDTWNLMPSVVYWDKSGLKRAMNLR